MTEKKKQPATRNYDQRITQLEQELSQTNILVVALAQRVYQLDKSMNEKETRNNIITS